MLTGGHASFRVQQSIRSWQDSETVSIPWRISFCKQRGCVVMAASLFTQGCIVIQPEQVARLEGLARAASSLFKRNGGITVVDLLYAALWRGICREDLRYSLTLIEDAPKNSCSEDDLTALEPENCFVRYTLSATSDYLASRPLVVVAHEMRCAACREKVDFPYEGWLIDSFGDGMALGDTSHTTTHLTLSSVPFVCVEKFLIGRTLKRSPIQGVTRSGSINADLPPRICCINTEGLTRGIRESIKADIDRASYFASCCDSRSISIDIRLPRSEFESFMTLCAGPMPSMHGLSEYGDSRRRFARDEFLEN